MQAQGHAVSQATVWRLLDELDYSMQSNRKTREGTGHIDRNAQFEFINGSAKDFLARGWPVISVDTKKKELHKSHVERNDAGDVAFFAWIQTSPQAQASTWLYGSRRGAGGLEVLNYRGTTPP